MPTIPAVRRAAVALVLIVGLLVGAAVTARPAAAAELPWTGTPMPGTTMTFDAGAAPDIGSHFVHVCDSPSYTTEAELENCPIVPSTVFAPGTGQSSVVVPQIVDHYLYARVQVVVFVSGLPRTRWLISSPIGPILPVAGQPTITGRAAINEMLMVDVGLWDHRTSDFTFHWTACSTSCFSLGTDPSIYITDRSVQGATIAVAVTADIDGVAHTMTSAATVPVAGGEPAGDTPTTVTGTPEAGSTLHAASGFWHASGGELPTYFWLSCPGATTVGCNQVGSERDYVVAESDAARYVFGAATITNTYGTGVSYAEPLLIASHAPTVTRPGSFTAAPVVGTPATVAPATFAGSGPPTTGWVWQRCSNQVCVDIAGATNAATYTPLPGDRDAVLQVVSTATNPFGTFTDTAVAGQVTSPPAPVATVSPTLSGTAVVGHTLAGSPGMWSHGRSFTYSWARCDTTLDSCEGLDDVALTYDVTSNDVGFRIVFTATATGLGGSTSADVASAVVTLGQVGPTRVTPLVTGTARTGETLTATAPDWDVSGSTVRWRWQRCDPTGSNCTDIDGATAATYKLGTDDLGSTVRVLVIAAGQSGNAMGPSDPTAVVVSAASAGLDDDTVSVGDTITVTGEHFAPNSPVAVSLDAVILGTAETDAGGNLRATFTLPAGVTAGAHQVVLAGVDAAGEPVTVSESLTVSGPADTPDTPDVLAPTPSTDTGPTVDDEPRTAAGPGAAASAPVAGGQLARTGSPVTNLVGPGLGLMLVGGAALVSSRRRVR